MSKVTISQVAEILKAHKDISPTTLRQIVEELNAKVEPEKESVAGPRGKSQFVILLDSNRSTGWVVQLPEDASPASLLDRVNLTAHDFNASKKGRLLPVKTHGEALESVPRRFWKEHGVQVKTKIPVTAIVTTNKLTEPPTA